MALQAGDIRIGMEVDIKRSDGRIHRALISSINHKTRSVIVEWYEMGDAKGKEIEWHTLLDLNPHLSMRESYDCFPDKTDTFGFQELEKSEFYPLPETSRSSVSTKSSYTGTNHSADYCSIESLSTNKHVYGQLSAERPFSTTVECHTGTQTDWTMVKSIEEDFTSKLSSSKSQDNLDAPLHSSITPRVNDVKVSKMKHEFRQSHPSVSSTPYKKAPASSRLMDIMAGCDDPTTATQQSTAATPVIAAAKSSNPVQLLKSTTPAAEKTKLELPIVNVAPDVMKRNDITARPVVSDSRSTAENRMMAFSPTPFLNKDSLLKTTQEKDNAKIKSPATPTPVRRPPNPNVRSKRRLSCLQGIEIIQQKREERRAAQQQKANNRGQAEYDSSIPQWEFLLKIREYQDTLQYIPFSRSLPVETFKICVCVRKRPLSRSELLRKEIDVITIPQRDTVIVHEPKIKVDLTKYLDNQIFRFDYVFDADADNSLVYECTAQPLIRSLFEGGMATCFAYGQTGSGKTHTMSGEMGVKGEQDVSHGIYGLAARDLFDLLETQYNQEVFSVEVAYFEIYGVKVFDLLNGKAKLRMLEDYKGQVHLAGLKYVTVNAVDEVLDCLTVGNHCRTSGQTAANSHSSRSHAVFQLRLMKPKFSGPRMRDLVGVPLNLHGQFSLIDLAGNERGADTRSSDKQTRMEGAEINKSLLALKECIRALGRKPGTHLPFRGSKLTQVLRDSFLGEQSRTCMIAMVSPGSSSCENTMNTLRYADRVKELSNSSGPSTVNNVLINQPAAVGIVMEPAHNNPRDYHRVEDLDLIDNKQLNLVMDEEKLDEIRDENLHAALERITAMEEDICEDNKTIVELYPSWITQHKKLFKQTNRVDYDVEKYAEELESVLDKQLTILKNLKEKVGQWNEEMR